MPTDDLKLKVSYDDVEAQKGIDRLDKKMASLQGTAKTLSISGAAAFGSISAGVTLAVKKFGGFESKFTDVVTLLDQGSFSTKSLNEGISDLKDGVLALGAETGQPFDDLNKGLFDIVSAGVPAEKAIGTLTAATQLASAGATDTATAVDGLTTTMNAFGLGADSSRIIAEKFFTAQKFGKTTIEELSTNMGKAAAVASATGVSFDEVLASVSAATLGGIKTEAAFTSLKAALSNVQKPTAEATAEAERLGIQFDSTSLRSQGLSGFLDTITSSAGYNKTSLEKLFGSTEALGLMLSITGEQADDFDKILGGLNDTSTRSETFQDALATKQQNVQLAFNKAARSIEEIVIIIGEQFAPAITNISGYISDFAKVIAGMDDDTKQNIVTLTEFVVLLTGSATVAAGAVKAYQTISGGLKALGIMFDILKTKSTAAYAAATLGLTLVATVAVAAIAEWMTSNDDIVENTKKTNKELSTDEKSRNEKIAAMQKTFMDKRKAIDTAWRNGEIKTSAEYHEKLKAAQAELNQSFETLNNEKNTAIQTENDKARALEAAKIAEDNAKRNEVIKLQNEQELAFQAEFQGLSAEQRALYTSAEKEKLLSDQVTNETLEKESGDRIIAQQQETERRRLEAHRLFTGEMHSLDEIMHSSIWKGTKDAADELAKLKDSKNTQLKEIGKAATIVQLGMSTAEGALKAFNGLAWIPVVGPGFGLAAAAAVTAYGAQQMSEVQKFQTGGFVPGAAGGSRDRVPALLEPGEFVIPKSMVDKLPPSLLEMLWGKNTQRFAAGGEIKDDPGRGEQKGIEKDFWGMFDPFKIFKAALAGKVGDIASAGGPFAEVLNQVPAAIMGNLLKAMSSIQNIILKATPIGQLVSKLSETTGIDIDELMTQVPDLIGKLGDVAQKGAKSLTSAAQGITGKVSEGVGYIAHVAGFKDGGIVPFAAGGMVDRVPAMLSPGEAVLPSKTTAEILRGERTIGMGRKESEPQEVVVRLAGDAGRIFRAETRKQNALGI